MKNSGASFGMNFWGLNIVAVILIIIIFLIWKKDRNTGWLLIILGGLLNVGERLIWGEVTDYWRIPFTQIYNNFSDYLIFIGGIMVIWSKWRNQQ